MLADRYLPDGIAAFNLNDIRRHAKDQVVERLTNGMYETERVPCALCNLSSFTPLSGKDRYGLPMAVVACQNCGLVQTNPRMTTESYGHFYDSEYRPLEQGRQRASQDFFRFQTDRGAVIYRWLERRELLPQKGASILDVGCGAGGTLVAFRRAGYKVSGVDLGSEYVAYGRNVHDLDLRVGTLSDCRDQADLIIYRHVFEHLTCPQDELRTIRDRLTPNGIVYIEVPGIKNLAKVDKDFLMYCQLPHVFHFSRTTLRLMVERSGFRVLRSDETIRAAFAASEDEVDGGELDGGEYEAVLRYLRRSEQIRPYARAAAPVLRPATGLVEGIRAEGATGILRRRLGSERYSPRRREEGRE
jgi:SAM-dependent methyltransferase